MVWLNEAQTYLGQPRLGEDLAAALHELLTRPDQSPVLVLGTLWPEAAAQFTASPSPGTPDPHSRTRELLSGRLIHVPDTFDEEALKSARALAQHGDTRLAEALVWNHHGRVTQWLAAGPALVARYANATPGARAILNAAIDARRLGVGEDLPISFLIAAAVGYLSDSEFDQLLTTGPLAPWPKPPRPSPQNRSRSARYGPPWKPGLPRLRKPTGHTVLPITWSRSAAPSGARSSHPPPSGTPPMSA
ncbi:hypothetical protein ACIBW9_36990 [Streptomyces sp. NPDC049541]|uniref:hypothetical protein n=1 Tax=Streptomyces sp. NPDC049541 TaxID=3365594 RepID=UPI00379CB733